MATPVVHGNAKTDGMISFGADEHPRSLQLYGSRPADHGPGRAQAVRRRPRRSHRHQLRLPGGQGHPPRRGSGRAGPSRAAAGDPARRGRPTRRRTACRSPPSSGWGCSTTGCTHIRTGEVCAEEGVAAIALHARTVQQHYSGEARWDAIGELKQAVGTIPVLGNGDIWEAADAVRMMAATGCDGVVDRSRLPRSSVAVRRPRRGAVGPPGARESTARRRDGRHARARPPAVGAHGREPRDA